MAKKRTQKNWLEWTVTIISSILVLFTLGFLVYQLAFEERTSPSISVVLGEVSKKDEAFAVPITAFNKGTETAENVIIEIVSDTEEEQEKSEITFAFLPGKSSVKGWIIFTNKPQSKNLKTHVKGYSTP